ncbi:hypothetical protein ABZP36_018946 [Zizania latifolia]
MKAKKRVLTGQVTRASGGPRAAVRRGAARAEDAASVDKGAGRGVGDGEGRAVGERALRCAGWWLHPF